MPKSPSDANATIGVWASASRQKSKVLDSRQGKYVGHGPYKQVSRLGNPLVNEVLIPMAEKDEWNARPPRNDSRFAKYVDQPELAGLLPALYPGVFPKLEAYSKSRADLDAILLTGIPSGVVPGFQNFTGRHQGGHAAAERGGHADQRRRTRSGWSPVTRPGSRTGAGSATTS